MINRIIATSIGLLLLNFSAFSQEDKLKKEVQVVRPYEPTISDAFKLNILPQIDDTVRIVPTFSYNLTLRPVTIDFPISSIAPARITSEPLTRINKAYFMAGFGNYSSPLAEIFITNGRSEKLSLGASFRYNSSFGDIKLDNNELVDGTFQRIAASAFGKRVFKKSALAGNIDFNRFSYGFYGYDHINLTTPPDVNAQHQQRAEFAVKYFSTHSDSSHLNYNFDSRFTNFIDNFGMQQNTFIVQSNFDRHLKIEKFGGNVEFVHHMNSSGISPSNNTILRVSPWIGLFGKQWRVQAGLGITININNFGSQTNLYPIAQLSYNVISNYVIPYFQFSGYLEDNSYSKILNENPWILPGLNLSNSSHKFIIKGGIKGNLSPRIAYNLSARYSLIDSAYFFVNAVDPTNTFLENRFDVVYDNIQLKTFMGELTIAPTNTLKFFFNAEYNIYTMKDVVVPWHKPTFIGRAHVSYSINNKVLLNAGLFVEGNRQVRALDGNPKVINGISDLNIGGEYRFNKRVSLFLNLNNLTASKYQLWYLYPAQQFNARGGFTYNF
jgi:hypothetical protein